MLAVNQRTITAINSTECPLLLRYPDMAVVECHESTIAHNLSRACLGVPVRGPMFDARGGRLCRRKAGWRALLAPCILVTFVKSLSYMTSAQALE